MCVCVGVTENLLNHRLHLHPSTPLTHIHTYLSVTNPCWNTPVASHLPPLSLSLPFIPLSFLGLVLVAQACEYLSNSSGPVDLLCHHLQLKVVAFRKSLYINSSISVSALNDVTPRCVYARKHFKHLKPFSSLLTYMQGRVMSSVVE